jgi:hypothetical protein
MRLFLGGAVENSLADVGSQHQHLVGAEGLKFVIGTVVSTRR